MLGRRDSAGACTLVPRHLSFVPFSKVLVKGIVRRPSRKKMSEATQDGNSLANAIEKQTMNLPLTQLRRRWRLVGSRQPPSSLADRPAILPIHRRHSPQPAQLGGIPQITSQRKGSPSLFLCCCSVPLRPANIDGCQEFQLPRNFPANQRLEARCLQPHHHQGC